MSQPEDGIPRGGPAAWFHFEVRKSTDYPATFELQHRNNDETTWTQAVRPLVMGKSGRCSRFVTGIKERIRPMIVDRIEGDWMHMSLGIDWEPYGDDRGREDDPQGKDGHAEQE